MLLFLPGLLLTSCASTGVEISHDYCQYGTAIYISKQDQLTDKTAEQILTNNETWAAICPKAATNVK